MNKSVAISLLIVLVLAGSLFFLFVNNPESKNLSSDDHDFVFRAMARDASFELKTEQGGAATARLSPKYVVKPEVVLEAPASVSLRSNEAPEGKSLAVFNSKKGAWEWIATEYDDGRFIAEPLRTGAYALLQEQKVEPPTNFAEYLNDVLFEAPENVEAARFEVAYALEGDDYVIVPGVVASAACGGEFLTSSDEVLIATKAYPTTNIDVADVVKKGSWLLISEWSVGDGCGEGQLELVR